MSDLKEKLLNAIEERLADWKEIYPGGDEYTYRLTEFKDDLIKNN